MERDLWYLFSASEGARTRIEILRLLLEEPRNANRLAATLDVDYTTVRYHLDAMCDRGVVEPGPDAYGREYAPTDAFDRHREAFERILEAEGIDSVSRGRRDR